METVSLQLVRVSNDYPTYMRPTAFRESNLEGDNGLFYAVTDLTVARREPNHMTDHALLVVAEDDPRHAGMWETSPSGPFPGHYGWNIPHRYLTVVEDAKASLDAVRALQRADSEHALLVARVEELQETIANLRESMRRQSNEFESWKERAQEIATQYANDNSLCEEFDRCMEEIGLEGRRHEYRITVSVSVEASNEDDAWEIYCDQYAGDSSWAEIERE